MIKRLINIRHIIQVAFSLVLLTLVGSSCQQEFARLIPEQDLNRDSVSVVFGAPKVLYLIVDGARGESVRTAGAVAINGLLNQSIYSWVSISDETATGNGTNWADMLTGVGKNKHGVIDDNFANNKFDSFPLIYKRIKEARPESNIRVFTPSALFKNNLTAGVDVSEVLSDDKAVKDALVNNLAAKDITLLVGHFTSVDKAGALNGYDNSIAAYKNAILKFDDYVNEMLNALKARPSYKEENWLVVIASSKGGNFTIPASQNDNTIFSNPDVNTFTIFHAPKYNPRFIGKPYLGNRYQGEFPRFYGNRYAQVSEGNSFLYNFGMNSFAVELKVKKNKGPNNNYTFTFPAIIGKRSEWSKSWNGNGWVIFLDQSSWGFNARGPGNSQSVKGGLLSDATWNSIAVVGLVRGGDRFIRTYTNGNFNTEVNVTSWGSFDNEAPLKIGRMGGDESNPDVYISDIRIWGTALADDVIKNYACQVGVEDNHPLFPALVGYWPVVGSGGGMTIRDDSGFRSHMTLGGDAASWDRLSEYVCAPLSSSLGSLVPKNVDIPAQIITWLKISRQESWQFDGRVWLDR